MKIMTYIYMYIDISDIIYEGAAHSQHEAIMNKVLVTANP